jgi:hypothetical protein
MKGKDSMKNFFRSLVASDHDNSLNEQNQSASIELNEQELESATGGCGGDWHHHDDCDYHHDDCDYDYHRRHHHCHW